MEHWNKRIKTPVHGIKNTVPKSFEIGTTGTLLEQPHRNSQRASVTTCENVELC